MTSSINSQFVRRAGLVLAVETHGNAQACVQDAFNALNNAQTGVLYPVSNEGRDAELWLATAERWMSRAAQHAFGYNLPAEW